MPTNLALTRRAFLGAALASGQPSRRPPNIVLVLADDLGWADTSVYGADLHQTPHIDQLASEGVRFTNAYSAAPICSPTRASIMTGKWPARLNMTIWYEGALRSVTNRKMIPPQVRANLPHSEVTLAEHLGRAGYTTAIVGKWHLGDGGFYPETQGFDTNIGGTHWGAPPTFFYPYRGDRRFGGEFRYVPRMDGGREGEYLTDRLTTEALGVIDRAGSQPFFLYLAHHSPHTPIEAPAPLVERYRSRLKPGLHHTNATYAAMVHSLDQSVGRLAAHLKKKGVYDNTVFVFTSDNGGYIGKFDGDVVTNNHPLRSGKGSLYEGGIRIPMIVCAPGGARNRTSDTPVFTADLFPTLLARAGVTAPATHDGRDLAGVLADPGQPLGREDLFFHYPHYYETTTPVSAIRSGDWKLLEYFEDNHVELYDLKADPRETTDLAARQPERSLQLRSRLQTWRRDVGAQLPTVNPAGPAK